MDAIRYDQREGGSYADFAAWMAGRAGDNGGDLRRLRRNLRVAREEVLTDRQRELLRLHYEEQLGVREIARREALAPSTVSRTIARAKHKLYNHLRYGL